MSSDCTNHHCAQCGEVFLRAVGAKGQAASWCADCRRQYMRKYVRDHYVPVDPVLGPKKPNGKWIACKICGTVVSGRRSMCGSAECLAESMRRASRQRRQDKPPSHVKNKRQADRRRRALKRGVQSEPYDPLDIAERDGWRCSLCGKAINRRVRHPHPLALTMDHVVPVSAGGDDASHNVRACHSRCNSVKGNRVHGAGEQLMLIG